MRLSAVEGNGAAAHVEDHGVGRIQLVDVGRLARARVLGPIPEAAPLEVAQGAHHAQTGVVVVAVPLGRVVLVDTDRREGELHSLLEPGRRVVVQVLAQQLSHHGELHALLRNNEPPVDADIHESQHLGAHEGVPVGDHVLPLVVLPELPSVQDEGHVGVADLAARPLGLSQRPLGPPLGEPAPRHPGENLEGVPRDGHRRGRPRASAAITQEPVPVPPKVLVLLAGGRLGGDPQDGAGPAAPCLLRWAAGPETGRATGKSSAPRRLPGAPLAEVRRADHGVPRLHG
mmetsp:Transcript_35383/g.110316  ORF Transcript_35383/g.110316 Transcript_35383/m.110316 type:complete len:287 (-) Transcript_35383:757-1617(-)